MPVCFQKPPKSPQILNICTETKPLKPPRTGHGAVLVTRFLSVVWEEWKVSAGGGWTKTGNVYFPVFVYKLKNYLDCLLFPIPKNYISKRTLNGVVW